MRCVFALVLALALLACSSGRSVDDADEAQQTTAATTALDARLVIDVREPADFARGHTPGAINLQLGWKQLAARVEAYVPSAQAPLVVVAADEDELATSLELLRAAGYSDLRGTLSLDGAGTLSVWDVERLEAALASDTPPVLIDVRTPDEWRTGTIEGALLVDEDDAPRLVEKLDPAREYAIICEGGYRSSQLASLLQRNGFTRVHNVIDGMYAWRAKH